MSQADTRALSRAAILLLVASGIRLVHAYRPLPGMAGPSRPDALPELLEGAHALRAEDDRRGRPLGEGELLDPNQADEIELDRLPGVGPAAARAIVREREASGVFGGPDDLLRVPGIGEATLARIRPHLRLSGRPPAGTPSVGRSTPPVLDLNRAGETDLTTLPGVGPALAARILELRSERGRFKDIRDLLEVRGIGEVTLERLRPLVTVR